MESTQVVQVVVVDGVDSRGVTGSTQVVQVNMVDSMEFCS